MRFGGTTMASAIRSIWVLRGFVDSVVGGVSWTRGRLTLAPSARKMIIKEWRALLLHP